MEIIAVVIFSLIIIMAIFCLIMLVRNEQVYKYSMSLNDRIHFLGMDEIDRGYFDPVTDRWVTVGVYQKLRDELTSVEYNYMVTRFWRPLDSFFSKEFHEALKDY